MTNSRPAISALVLSLPLVLAGCAGADAQPKPIDRSAEGPLIIGEVLRYQIQQFAPKEAGASGVACVGVREDGLLADPSPAIMRSLGSVQARPQSACKEARVLIAGPVEWRQEDEVRVQGGYLQGSQGETRLAYRVVREGGRWVCLGPIISWDPL